MSAWTTPPSPAGRAEPPARPDRLSARPTRPAAGAEPPAGRLEPSSAAPEPQPGRPADPPSEHHLPAGAHVADRRGLTAAGAVTVALVLGIAGAAVDVNTGRGLRTVFAICFVVGCALAALLVHREDLKAAVVMPPLVYCVLALVGGALGQTPAAGSFVKSQGLELVTALVLGAPVLFTATAAALLIALARAASGRRGPRVTA